MKQQGRGSEGESRGSVGEVWGSVGKSRGSDCTKRKRDKIENGWIHRYDYGAPVAQQDRAIVSQTLELYVLLEIRQLLKVESWWAYQRISRLPTGNGCSWEVVERKDVMEFGFFLPETVNFFHSVLI